MIKTIIVLAIVLGVIFALSRMPTTSEYSAPEVLTETKEVTIEVDALDKAILDAQNAQEETIKSTAQKAFDEAYNQEMKKVELQVIKDFNDKLDARQIELEEQVSL